MLNSNLLNNIENEKLSNKVEIFLLYFFVLAWFYHSLLNSLLYHSFCVKARINWILWKYLLNNIISWNTEETRFRCFSFILRIFFYTLSFIKKPLSVNIIFITITWASKRCIAASLKITERKWKIWQGVVLVGSTIMILARTKYGKRSKMKRLESRSKN